MTSSPALQQQAPFPYSLFSSFRNLYPPSNNHINHIGPPFSRLALSDHAHDVIMRSADYRMIFASYRTSHADEDDSFASSLGLDPLEEEVIRRRNVRARVMERVLPQIVHSIVSGSGAIGETMHDAANNEEMHAPASQRTIEELTVTTVKVRPLPVCASSLLCSLLPCAQHPLLTLSLSLLLFHVLFSVCVSS